MEKLTRRAGSGNLMESSTGGNVAVPAKTTEKTIQKSGITSVILMGCTLASRILGLARNAVITFIFGGSGTADVWNLVFMIPNNFRKLFAEGALSSAFIPVLSSSLVKDSSGEESRKISRNIISFQLLILVPVTFLGIIFAGPLMNILALFPDPEKMALSVPLFRYVFSYVLFISISAVLMGVLNSNNVFIPPALTPLIFSVTTILSIGFLHPLLGIYSVVPGILLGGVLQIIVQLPFYHKKGYDLRPDFNFANDNFRQILKLWLPILIASSIFTINQQVAMVLASALEDGSTSALSNALVFFQLPFGIITASITTVLFPRMSREAASRNIEDLRSSFSYGLNFILIFLIPAAIAYLMLGEHIIALVLERGKFLPENTLMTFRVLSGYSLGLFSLGAFTFCQRFFYAFKDYKTPVIVSAGVVVIDILLSVWLMNTPLRVSGLAVANSVAFTIGFIVLLFMARSRIKRIGGKRFVINLFKVGASMVVFILSLYLYINMAGNTWQTESSLLNLAYLSGAVLMGMGITFVLYYITRIDIIRGILKGKVCK